MDSLSIFFETTGLNTTHVKKSRHPLCLQYLDVSPLERMHVAEAYMLCSHTPSVNIFGGMTTKDYNAVRTVVVKLVLATDLAAHFGFVEKLKLRGEGGAASNVDNIVAMKIAIKISDIGHCAKELQLHLKWSEAITEEFYRQGDLERLDVVHFPNGPVKKKYIYYIIIYVMKPILCPPILLF